MNINKTWPSEGNEFLIQLQRLSAVVLPILVKIITGEKITMLGIEEHVKLPLAKLFKATSLIKGGGWQR